MLILMLAVPFIGVFGISAVVIAYGVLSDWRERPRKAGAPAGDTRTFTEQEAQR